MEKSIPCGLNRTFWKIIKEYENRLIKIYLKDLLFPSSLLPFTPKFSNRKKMSVSLIRPKRPVIPWWKRFGIFCYRLWDDLRSQCSTNPLDQCRWIRFASALKNVSDNPKDQLARAGEEEAVLLLREKGYIILQQNIRMPEGELDIVARNDSTLVFLEVKTRRKQKYSKPSETVNAAKQQRQIKIAQQFLSLCHLTNIPIRFDIISVVWSCDAPPTIQHVENAFSVDNRIL
jgi:putative endonuclease